MIAHVITLFPDILDTYFAEGVVGKAIEKGVLYVKTIQLRDFAGDKHRTVDDYPYGGGAGMILKPDVMDRAVTHAMESCEAGGSTPVILTTPHGRMFDSSVARELSALHEAIFICGHYGGIDQRFVDRRVTDEISIGDYVLTGGELPAMVMIDAAARFLPGVLGNEESAAGDTFEDGLLGAPNYTRPPVFDGAEAPEVLLSGHHANIEAWRRRRKLELTARRRPDLLRRASISDDDRKYIEKLETDTDYKE